MKRLLFIAAALLSLLVACTPLAPTPTSTPLPITPMFFPTDIPTPVPTPVYLSLIWHFHQPLYTTDPQTGLVTLPWVRVNATRYYYGAGAVLQQYPKVHATVNLSPLLHRQLDDISSGARDIYWELSTRPANSLNDTDKLFLLSHFFDGVNPATIKASPRYQELQAKRGDGSDAAIRGAVAAYTEQDLRDLQVWFNLNTFSPELLSASPLHELMVKDRGFSEDDKQTLFEVLLATIRAIDPLYAQLQDSGQVELTTSPYSEAIIPLLLDTNTLSGGITKRQLPDPPFTSQPDVTEQLKRANESYQRRYGHPARGLLLPGGVIAQNVVQPLISAGVQWTATGQEVLSRTLKDNSNGTGLSADALYRPYALHTEDGKPLSVVFSASGLAERIAHYSALSPESAAEDFINQIHAIKSQLAAEKASGSHLVTVVLDGDLTLQSFADGGHSFLEALYQRLSTAADNYDIQTITPVDYMIRFPGPRALKAIAPGAMGSQDQSGFSAWIGSAENNAIWNNLGRAHRFLDDYLTGAKTSDKTALAHAYDALLLAEGSDWLKPPVGGAGSESTYFDRGFRDLLGQVYASVGVPLPDYLQVSMRPTTILAGNAPVTSIITPTIDGAINGDEWAGANVIRTVDAAAGNGVIDAFYFGANAENLFFRIDARDDWSTVAASVDSLQPLRVGVYIAKPGAPTFSDFTRLGGDGEIRVALGMNASHLLEWTLDPDGTSATALYSVNGAQTWAGTATLFAPGATLGKVLEIASPRKALGGLTDLAKLNLVVVVTRGGRLISTYPMNGLAQMTIPAGGGANTSTEKVIGEFDDRADDDNGPGTYSYPTSSVFEPHSFDLKRVSLSITDKNLIFRVELNGPIANVWNSPIGLSVQTFDIYIDKDPGKGTGARKLLDGRNAALSKGNGWEYALWIEGWEQQLYAADAKGNVSTKNNPHVTVEIDPAGVATIAAPLAQLGDGNPETWGYAIAILGQDAFPAQGVLRVRDVDSVASEWRFGGAPNDTNHTRIVDVLDAPGAKAGDENSLSHYRASMETDMTKLTADDFGTIPLVTIRK